MTATVAASRRLTVYPPLEDLTRVRTLPDQVRPVHVRDPVWDNDAATDQMARGALAATVTLTVHQ